MSVKGLKKTMFPRPSSACALRAERIAATMRAPAITRMTRSLLQFAKRGGERVREARRRAREARRLRASVAERRALGVVDELRDALPERRVEVWRERGLEVDAAKR